MNYINPGSLGHLSYGSDPFTGLDNLGTAFLIAGSVVCLVPGGIGYAIGGGKGFVAGFLTLPVILFSYIGIKNALR